MSEQHLSNASYMKKFTCFSPKGSRWRDDQRIKFGSCKMPFMDWSKQIKLGIPKITGAIRSEFDHNLYTMIEEGKYVIINLYVDDLMLTRDHSVKLTYIQEQLERKFEMSHLGVMKVYIEVKFIYLLIGVMLVQKFYAKVILERFKMDSCKHVTTPMEEGLQLHF